MEGGRIILNQILDIGGIATKNNFYSPNATTLKGALLQTHKYYNDWQKAGLIKLLPSVIRIRNKRQELFYAITAKGASYIDRREDYKIRSQPKSPYNVMHESMVRDVAISFLRNYPEYDLKVSYDQRFEGIRPDITLKMKHKGSDKEYIFLVEIERKKSVERIVKEKLSRYEAALERLNFKEHKLNAPVKVLVIFSNLDYNCFYRPQEYYLPVVQKEILKHKKQLKNLVRLSNNLPLYRYRFLAFNDFHRLHLPIWLTPAGEKFKIMN